MDKTLKNIFILVLVIVSIFGYLDAMQIVPWQQSEQWEIYTQYVVPAILGMWTITLLAVAIVYYLIKKDKSEAVGIFVAAKIMMMGGVQDVMFFVLSSNKMTSCMEWFKGPQSIISRLLGETCVSPLSLIINASISIFLAWWALKWFKKQKW
jgi:hypothetical protein